MTTEQIISIMTEKDLCEEFATELDVNDTTCTYAQALTDFYEGTILSNANEDEERILALMEHTNELYDECDKDLNTRNSYKVLTDDEADVAWDDELEDYIDECILPDLPESIQMYFDREKFKSDASMDSRGNSLSTYDGCEYSETINDTEYFIYKQ